MDGSPNHRNKAPFLNFSGIVSALPKIIMLGILVLIGFLVVSFVISRANKERCIRASTIGVVCRNLYSFS